MPRKTVTTKKDVLGVLFLSKLIEKNIPKILSRIPEFERPNRSKTVLLKIFCDNKYDGEKTVSAKTFQRLFNLKKKPERLAYWKLGDIIECLKGEDIFEKKKEEIIYDFESYLKVYNEVIIPSKFANEEEVKTILEKLHNSKGNAKENISDEKENTIITIEEIPQNNSIKLSFPDKIFENITFTPPNLEEDLDWYFEYSLVEPYHSNERSKRCSEYIKSYGKKLFAAIFNKKSISSKFKSLIDKVGYDNIILNICSKQKSFDSIIWESIWETNENKPLIAKGVELRRVVNIGKHKKVQTMNVHPINILVITARNQLGLDIEYQTVQHPLVTLASQVPSKVNVHILRPRTFESFRRHLFDNPRHYHLLHFDLHGSVLSYDDLEGLKKSGKIQYHTKAFNKRMFFIRDGVGELKRFEGRRSFLYFEDDLSGKTIPYDAEELSDFLESSGVQFSFINACQSAKQNTRDEISNLASIFATSGILGVFAMRYSVSVSSVLILVKSFYENLLIKNHTILESFNLARRELFFNKTRRGIFDKEISLDDWVVPVLYTNKIIENYKVTNTSYTTQYVKKPDNEFLIGRDIDIIKIENQLLKNNILNIFGVKGVGKTKILNYCSSWWCSSPQKSRTKL